MVDEKEYWCGKCIKNKIFFAIFMSFPLDKLHRGGGKIFLYIHFNEKENRYEKIIRSNCILISFYTVCLQ